MIMYSWSTNYMQRCCMRLHLRQDTLAVCSDADLQAGSQYELKSYSAGVQCLSELSCIKIQACRLTNEPQLRSGSDATPPMRP
jgi:hypothetical protein